MSIVYPPSSDGHRLRLRERFDRSHGSGWHDYEVLELLLTYAIVRRDVKPLAKVLLSRFGSLAGVMDASAHDLRRTPGVGPATATLIRLAKQLGTIYLGERLAKRDVMSSPERVADFATLRLAGLPHEAFMVIYLNVQNELLAHEILNEGTIDQVAVYPRRVIEQALAHHAAGLILAHNHPSGHTAPSDDDKRLTAAISSAARVLISRFLIT